MSPLFRNMGRVIDINVSIIPGDMLRKFYNCPKSRCGFSRGGVVAQVLKWGVLPGCCTLPQLSLGVHYLKNFEL